MILLDGFTSRVDDLEPICELSLGEKAIFNCEMVGLGTTFFLTRVFFGLLTDAVDPEAQGLYACNASQESSTFKRIELARRPCLVDMSGSATCVQKTLRCIKVAAKRLWLANRKVGLVVSVPNHPMQMGTR